MVQRVNALKQQLADAESEQRQLSAQVSLRHLKYMPVTKALAGISSGTRAGSLLPLGCDCF